MWTVTEYKVERGGVFYHAGLHNYRIYETAAGGFRLRTRADVIHSHSEARRSRESLTGGTSTAPAPASAAARQAFTFHGERLVGASERDRKNDEFFERLVSRVDGMAADPLPPPPGAG